jgi:excisionase family DNA binding protein
MHAATKPDETPVTVSVQRAKAITGLGHTTIYKLIDNGQLKSTKIGDRRLIFYASIEELLRQPA